MRDPHTGKVFQARGAVAVDPRHALRMILIGPGGVTALDAWITDERFRFVVPPISLERRGGGDAESARGLPIGFFRWWMLHPLDGRLLAAWNRDEGPLYLLRNHEETVLFREARVAHAARERVIGGEARGRRTSSGSTSRWGARRRLPMPGTRRGTSMARAASRSRCSSRGSGIRSRTRPRSWIRTRMGRGRRYERCDRRGGGSLGAGSRRRGRERGGDRRARPRGDRGGRGAARGRVREAVCRARTRQRRRRRKARHEDRATLLLAQSRRSGCARGMLDRVDARLAAQTDRSLDRDLAGGGMRTAELLFAPAAKSRPLRSRLRCPRFPTSDPCSTSRGISGSTSLQRRSSSARAPPP